MPEIVTIKVTTAGAAGSATGNTTVSAAGKPYFSGILSKAKIDYHASAPATTVVKLEEVGGLGSTIFTLAASATDKEVVPCDALADDTGSAIAGQYIPYITHATGYKVTVTLSDALTDCVTVTLLIS